MGKPASSVLAEFVMERLPEEPMAKRIQLTRALAVLTSDRDEQHALTVMADELEDIQRRHHQLLLNFRLRNGGHAS